MKKIFLALITLIVTMSGISASAQISDAELTMQRLNASLARMKTPKDSIRVLYDIFDLSPRARQPEVGRQIYLTAKRAGDTSTRLDILRLLTAPLTKDKDFVAIQNELRNIPASRERDETELFIKMKRMSYYSRFMPEAERQKQLVTILANWDKKEKKPESNPTKAKDDKFYQLYTVVEFLRNEASGDMLTQYLNDLIEQTKTAGFNLYALRNIVFAEASNIYSDAGDHRKAVESDHRLLEVIDSLEDKYHNNGRKYRNLDVSRYVVYRRMLRNFNALNAEEARELYAKCLKLGESNPDIKKDVENNPRVHGYYHMAVGDYNSAIPYLKEMLQKPDLALQERKQVLEHLIKAADNTGDDKTKIEALALYNSILEELNKTHAADKYKELQIKYDVQDLKSRNANLELENRAEEILSARKIMTFVLVAFIIMVAVLVLSLWNWSRYKRNACRMGDIVDKIHTECNVMRNATFGDYFDNPNAEASSCLTNQEGWKERMRKMSYRHDDASIFMTESIINDLLRIASVGHDNKMRHIEETSVDNMMRSICSRARDLTRKDYDINVEYPENDFTIKTDPECLVAILSHGLATALHYSPDHTVGMSVKPCKDSYVDFIFIIDGIEGDKPDDGQIFKDLSNMDNLLKRDNSGMFLCRLISFQLCCTKAIDSTYVKGAKYIYRVPCQLS